MSFHTDLSTYIIFVILFSIFLNPINAQTFNLGRFSIAENRVDLKLNDFSIKHDNELVASGWMPQSLQWIRNENNLLVPRALLKILIKKSSKTETVYLSFHHSTIFPVEKKDWYETQIYVDLFNPEDIVVFQGKNQLDIITVEAHSKSGHSSQLIDYSCSKYDLKITGVENDYLSVGCKMTRIGSLGHETPRLEVTMSSTTLQTLNGQSPPFIIYMEDSSPVKMQLKGAGDTVKYLTLNATIPTRLHRLTTAFGFGPYVYESKEKTATQNSNIAPSVMIYAKYDLTETASIKAFDAMLYSKTFFNNSGVYFSYDLASALDGRVLINALLGFQGLHYKHSSIDPTVFRLIYPQGFEVIYKHAFKENYNLTYGMFISTNSESYTNAWLRYGKSSFLELNYIKWGYQRSEIKMWGLSLGIPFFSIF